MLNNRDLKRIGYNYILSQLDLKTSRAKKYIKSIRLMNDLELANNYKSLLAIKEFLNNDYETVSNYLEHFQDITLITKKLSNSETLSLVEIFEIKSQLILYSKIKKMFSAINLENFFIYPVKDAILYLNNSDEITNDFMIYDKYHSSLKTLRKARDTFEIKYLKSDNFIEKEEILKLRNELVKEELVIEQSIRQIISDFLNDFIIPIEHNMNIITQLDIFIAKNLLAKNYNTCIPEFDRSIIEFRNLYNPHLKNIVEKKNLSYTNIDIDLKDGSTILTGANMGGKSSVIASLLLNVILARSGFYVFADYANIPFIDDVFYLYSTGADTNHGLSSFGNELVNLNTIINNGTKESLIMIDEFAQTTNPLEGRLLVKSLVNFLNSKSIRSLISTHYDNVSNNVAHYQIKGLKDGLTDFKDINSFMDYSLVLTNKAKTPKQAIKIAENILEDKELLNILIKNIEDDHYES